MSNANLPPIAYGSLHGKNGLIAMHHEMRSADDIYVWSPKTHTHYVIKQARLEREILVPNHYHEVIDFDHYRMFFDVDFVMDYQPGENERMHAEIREMVLAAIQRACNKYSTIMTSKGMPGIKCEPHRIAVLKGSRRISTLNYKVSLHFVMIDVILSGIEIAKRIKEYVDEFSPYKIDDLYTQWHPLRMHNSIKERHPLVFDEDHEGPRDPKLTIINGCRGIPQMSYDLTIINSSKYDVTHYQITRDINDYEVNKIITIIGELPGMSMSAFRVTKVSAGLYRMNRIHTSYCPICKREHDNDHMYFCINEGAGSTRIVLGCYRDKLTTMTIGSEPVNSSEISYIASDMINQAIDIYQQKSAQEINTAEFKDALFWPSFLRWFKSPDITMPKLICHRAPTGTGKTYDIIELMNILPDHHFIVISYRRVLTRQFAARMKDIDPMVYLEEKGSLYSRILIIQIDSMLRINVSKYRGQRLIIIMDEIDGILSHFHTLENNRRLRVTNALYQLSDIADHIIICDAYLQDIHIQPFLDHISFDIGKTLNLKMTESHIEYRIYTNQYTILSELLQENADDVIVIVCTTLTFARVIVEILNQTERFGSEEIIMYSSETPDSKITEDFRDINKALSGKKRIIYTPTILAGVDITIPVKALYLFGHLQYGHLTDIQIMQMIKRARTCDSYKLFIQSYNQYVGNHSYDTIIAETQNRMVWHSSSQYHNISQLSCTREARFMFSLDAAAEHVTLKARQNFIMAVVPRMLSYGGTIFVDDQSDGDEEEELIEYIKHVSGICSENLVDNLYRVSQTPNELLTNEDTPYEKIIQHCRRIYSHHHDVILTREHIARYFKIPMMIKYKNISRLLSFDLRHVIDETLDLCIKHSMHNIATNMAVTTCADRGQIIAIIMMLHAIGFHSIFHQTRALNTINHTELVGAIMMYYKVSGKIAGINRCKRNYTDPGWPIKQARRILTNYGIRLARNECGFTFTSDFAYYINENFDTALIDEFDDAIKQILTRVSASRRQQQDLIPPVVVVNRALYKQMSLGHNSHDYQYFHEYISRQLLVMISATLSSSS